MTTKKQRKTRQVYKENYQINLWRNFFYFFWKASFFFTFLFPITHGPFIFEDNLLTRSKLNIAEK